MKTSDTQARQSHFSCTVMDSGGKAETSRGWILSASFGFFVAALLAAGVFRRAGFLGFDGLADGLECRAGFLAGLDAGFGFRVGMGRSSAFQVYQRSGTAGCAPDRIRTLAGLDRVGRHALKLLDTLSQGEAHSSRIFTSRPNS